MAKVGKPMTYQMRKAKGSHGQPVQFPTFDSPLNHGWVKLRVSEIDGCVIFGLDGIAEMKQSLDVSGLWVGNVLVNGKWEGFELEQDLETLTAQIRLDSGRGDFLDFVDGPVPFEDDQIFSEAIHWDGDPEDNHPEPDTIPFPGEPMHYQEGVF